MEIICIHEVTGYLLWLEGRPLLHNLCTQDSFQGASVLISKSTEHIWTAFSECWATLYKGYPTVICMDQEAFITSDQFRKLGRTSGITIQLSGIEFHISLGAGERYHLLLRTTFSVVHPALPQVHSYAALSMTMKGMNETMGPECFIPTILVFGSLRSLSEIPSEFPSQHFRMEALRTAKEQMAIMVASQCIARALSSPSHLSRDT